MKHFDGVMDVFIIGMILLCTIMSVVLVLDVFVGKNEKEISKPPFPAHLSRPKEDSKR